MFASQLPADASRLARRIESHRPDAVQVGRRAEGVGQRPAVARGAIGPVVAGVIPPLVVCQRRDRVDRRGAVVEEMPGRGVPEPPGYSSPYRPGRFGAPRRRAGCCTAFPAAAGIDFRRAVAQSARERRRLGECARAGKAKVGQPAERVGNLGAGTDAVATIALRPARRLERVAVGVEVQPAVEVDAEDGEQRLIEPAVGRRADRHPQIDPHAVRQPRRRRCPRPIGRCL